MGMERISSAILEKVKAEALEIVREAEVRAKERVERAQGQQEARVQEMKGKLLEDARDEATRLMAQSAIKSRQELLQVKTRIIDGIIAKAKQTLADLPAEQNAVLDLIEEAVNALNVDKVRIYVAAKNLPAAQKTIKGNKALSGKVAEVKEANISGGIIAEDMGGKIRIDNSYDTRLEMLLPRLLPDIGKELFKDI